MCTYIKTGPLTFPVSFPTECLQCFENVMNVPSSTYLMYVWKNSQGCEEAEPTKECAKYYRNQFFSQFSLKQNYRIILIYERRRSRTLNYIHNFKSLNYIFFI